ncbi:hypothetical protein [Massilia scottii]|uniref:hypothetical protein n=1 Tax=Massilia scottii TaxID=3057166 RepID=UPI002796BF1F|nr:hypothetical protein [Massilia sp. CCM 9029]MDQ1831690.1 hypothetical protein [Massilia sp. CCM 9029]
MSSNYMLYYSFPLNAVPTLQFEREIFEKYGFNFLPSGYKYILENKELVEDEAEFVASQFFEISRVEIGNQLELIQMWEGDDGAGFSFGHISNNERYAGIMKVSGNDINRIKKHLATRGISLVVFLYDIYFSIGAEFLFGSSEDGMGIIDAFNVSKDKKMLADYTCADVGIVFGCAAENFNEELLRKFKLSSIKNDVIFTKWPFE